MTFSEKLQIIPKSRGMTQEQLAEILQVSRQAVAKWESGQSYPDIMNLITLSNIFHITVDYLVKDETCEKTINIGEQVDKEELVDFLIEAKRNTYAGFGPKSSSSRPLSKDYKYQKGAFLYIDSYVGGECFSGTEVVWRDNSAIFSMNYCGRTLDEKFSGDFLKEVLRKVDVTAPYRGPEFYQVGEYIYQSKVVGDMRWFQGYEEIFYGRNNNSSIHNAKLPMEAIVKIDKVYECYYHGGIMK